MKRLQNVHVRLERLENQILNRPQPVRPMSPLDRLELILTAVLLGDLKEHEAIAAGHARALGYAHEGKLREALETDIESVKERMLDCHVRLLRVMGLHKSSSSGEFVQAVDAVLARQPDYIHQTIARFIPELASDRPLQE